MSEDHLLWGAFRAARVGAWAWDIETNSVVWSQGVEDLFGLEPGTFDQTYEAYLALLDDESAARLREAVAKCLSGETTEYVLEHPIAWPDGSQRWLECRGSVVFDAGEPRRMFGTVADVTERRCEALDAESARQVLEAKLVHAQKLDSLGRLAGGVAHDFNNLLTAILSYAELAQRRMGPKCPVAPELAEISRTVQRAADLTGQLLTFARKQSASPQPVDVNRLVQSVADLLRRTVGERIEISLQLGTEQLGIHVDPGQLEQTLVNLAVNARDAMPDGGKLTLATERVIVDGGDATLGQLRPGAHVHISVTDTGTGMEAATLERVFEPFFTTKAPGQGTGLGLATCHGLVRQNGGDIRIASEPGRGTRVELLFPELDFATHAACQPERRSELPRGSETVLLVEDEAPVRAVVRESLLARGYRVLAAANGREALALAETHAGELDLLLTDVMLPGKNGVELAAELRKSRPSLRLLFVSGYSADSLDHTELDDAHFLAKPFGPEDLTRAVRAVLDGSRPAA